eukprot:m.266296 g.266296  ORF g.266296 m.266296 type:complete len:280 (+) comp19274_c0_seq5:196-1035(+)
MLVSEHQRVAILPILVLSTVIATGAAGNTGGEPTCDEPGCEYDVTDWLRPSTTQDIPLARFGRMKMKWQTPIYRVNSKGFLKMPTLHAELSSEVMKHYNGILQRNQLSLDASSHGVNQVFFEWQLRGGWEQFFAQRQDVKQLLKFFHWATDLYLGALGQSDDDIAGRSRSVHAWATVNKDCIGHSVHTHPDNMVSGVYYLQVPEDAGPIVFEDPRGGLPPFDDTEVIHPKEGDLILFPSWLRHKVEPTPGAEPRISLAFNMPGSWASTTGVAAEFDLSP